MKIKTLVIIGVTSLSFHKSFGQFTTNGSPYNTSTQATGGYVGIGTAAPTQLLQLGDRFVFHDGGYKYFGYNLSYSNSLSSNARLVSNDYASFLGFGNGDLNFETAPMGGNNTGGTAVTTTSRFIVKNSGEVGIGTAAPDAGKMLTVVGTGVNRQVAKFADNARYIGIGRDEVAAFELNGNLANLYLGGDGRLTVLTNSNVGVSTTTPYKRFTVNGDVSFANPSLAVNGNSGFEIVGNGQIPARRGISVDNDPSGKFNFYVHSWQTNAGFYFKEGLNNKTLVSINAAGRTDINAATEVDKYFVVNDQLGTPFESFVIYGDGRTRIGTQKPAASGPHADAKLSVDGKILAKSMYISITTGVWADYVFNKGYKLMPLPEVERFYQENHHLPGIKPAAEIEKNGMSVEEMNIKLLEKVEELTLYMVELKKEIDTIKNKK